MSLATFDYGLAAAPKDVVIWCPHDADYHVFLQKNKDILQALTVKHSFSLLERYLAIERDVGSLMLAQQIAKNIYEINNNLAIKVIAATLPRGIIDQGRIADCSRRNIFSNRMPFIDEQLIKAHQESLALLIKNFAELKPEGVFIDLHTMAPFNPKVKPATSTEYIIESHDNLAEYIDYYCDIRYRGPIRSIDLIISDQQGKQFADPTIVKLLSKMLQKTNIQFAYNAPFSTGEHLIALGLMKKHRGITVDVPKHFISNQDVDDINFDLAKIEINQEKVNYIATAIAQAFVAVSHGPIN